MSLEFFDKFSFDGFENPWRLILTFVLVLVYIVFSYRGLKPLTGAKRFILFTLRIIVIIFAVIILGEISIKKFIYARERGEVAVMIDTSRSMSMRSGDHSLTRLDAIKEHLRNNRGPFEELKNNYNLVFYSFSNDVEKIAESSINELKPTGNETDILTALNAALQKLERLSAVLLFSDGVDTEGLEHGLSDFKFPVSIFTFSPGSGTQKDVGLKNLLSSGFALNRERYELSFDITMRGWKQLDVPITLKDENAVIKTLRVNLKNGETKKVKMEFIPQKVGKQLFTIEVPVFTGDIYKENNRINFIVNVMRDRLRVLLLSGKPHWDLRFLRQILKTSPWIDLVNFNILRTPFDLANIPESELSLIPFPADEIFREGLDAFDVFIMQNFDPSQFVPESFLRNVVDFVKNGGGLAIVGGTLLSKANFYLSTEMSEVVPVNEGGRDTSGKYNIIPSPDTLNHPVNRFFLKNKELPSIDFINSVRGIKSWSTVLAETEGTRIPVVIAGNFGRGKVLAVLTNSFWRLAFSPEQKKATSDAYIDFWLNALRWLSGGAGESNILIEPVKNNFYSGEKVKLNVKALNKKYLPFKNSSVEIKVVNIDDGRIVFNKELKGSTGEELVEFNINEDGTYRVILQVSEGNRIIDGTESKIVIKNRKGEMETPFTNDELLRELADKTGGKFFNLTDNVKKIKIKEKSLPAFKEDKKSPLWNSFFIYLCTIIFLSLEWYLRRRWGLR